MCACSVGEVCVCAVCMRAFMCVCVCVSACVSAQYMQAVVWVVWQRPKSNPKPVFCTEMVCIMEG